MPNDIETRIALLEKCQRDVTGENAVLRTIVRSICLAVVVSLGVAYGCNRNDNDAKVESAKYAGSATTK